ncbi:stage II sporulation protein P [Thalassobacillus pellis]|uniref:stage II sporulation protein P n=1 Tax=Thalassobacillus pellis TaxID=748008 RepID=UPI0019619EA4|nr:stage II sporulation protein P [Thalassobacillus pellis]MBM7554708.1 stage II sporulation protein P [Thalassobacillus pellis]
MKKKKLLPTLRNQRVKGLYTRTGMAVGAMLALLLIIGAMTSVNSTYRIYSETIQSWTSQIEGPSFLYLFSLENRVFKEAYPENLEPPELSTLSFQLATSLTPNDPRSLLGHELPGLSTYNGEIIIAGKGTDYANLPVESHAPLDVVQKEQEAVEGEEKDPPEKDKQQGPSTNGKNIVYIYHSHNRESFLPHLPEGTDSVFHSEVNITKVGDRLGESLEANGIGAMVDHTDITGSLSGKGMEYYESYDAARPVVKEAMAENESLTYFFDLHRDALKRKDTTTEINGKDYARIMFVIGAEHPDYEKNLQLATDLHKKIEEKYPGISRGVIKKEGSGVDGKYNQDLSQKAILIEFGGVENKLEELYRTADIVAEVFSDYYWEDTEKVSAE